MCLLACAHSSNQEVPKLQYKKCDILFLRPQLVDPLPSSMGMTLLILLNESRTEMEHRRWKAGIKNMHGALAQCLDEKSRKHHLFLTEEQMQLRPKGFSL